MHLIASGRATDLKQAREKLLRALKCQTLDPSHWREDVLWIIQKM